MNRGVNKAARQGVSKPWWAAFIPIRAYYFMINIC